MTNVTAEEFAADVPRLGRVAGSALTTRLKASLIHLFISGFIALCLVAVVFFVWYPGYFARATGVTSVFLLMLAVDVCIGPLITLIVFDPRKRSLRFDLSVVAVLQLLALVYGTHTVFVGRPAYVVFNVDRFDLVQALDVDRKSQSKAVSAEFRTLPVTGPRWAGAVLPNDREIRNSILFSALAGGSDLPQRPEYYVALDQVRSEIKARLKPLNDLDKFNPAAALAEDQRLQTYRLRPQEYGFLPVRGPKADLTAIIDRSTGSVVDVLPVRPWNE